MQINPVSRSRAELVVVSFNFTTDATVADRQVVLQAWLGGILVDIGASLVVQPASQTYHYILGIGLTSSAAVVNNLVVVAFVPGVLIVHTGHWRIAIDNIQAGDQVGTQLLHEKYWVFEQ